MSLQLRRGSDAERQLITPLEGELIYVTDVQKLYAGDGSTVGGRLVSGINQVVDDDSPQIGGDLDLNTHNLIGTGNVSIIGSVTANSASISGDIISSGNITGGVISATTEISGDLIGSVYADDSNLLVDGVAGRLVLGNNQFAELADISINYSNPITNGKALVWDDVISRWSATANLYIGDNNFEDLSNVDINYIGIADGAILAYNLSTGKWEAGGSLTAALDNLTDVSIDTGNLFTGQALVWDQDAGTWLNGNPTADEIYSSFFGTLRGDVIGSVFADDSTPIIDGLTGTVNLTRNDLEDLRDIDITSSSLTGKEILHWEIGLGAWKATDVVTILNQSSLPVNIQGEFIGNFEGNFKGSLFADDSLPIIDGITGNIYTGAMYWAYDRAIVETDMVMTVNETTYELREGTNFNLRTIPNNLGGQTQLQDIYLGALRFEQYLDNNDKEAGQIRYFRDVAAVDTTDYPATYFLMTANANTSVKFIKFEGKNGTLYSDAFTANAFVDNSARDAQLTSAVPGTIIFNTAADKFQGYVNDTGGGSPGWVDLH